MKNIIIVGVVSLVLFSVSFALSIWLNSSRQTAATTKDEKDGKKKDDHGGVKDTPKDSGHAEDQAKKESDPKGQDKSAALKPLQPGPKDQIDRYDLRRALTEVILQDLRLQREEFDKRTKQLAAELKALQAEADANDVRARELTQIEQKNKQKEDDLKKKTMDVDKNEMARIEQIALMLDKMDAEKAAEMVQTYADSGNLDTMAKILSKMKSAKAAAVFSALTDPSLGPQLLDRMKAMTPPK